MIVIANAIFIENCLLHSLKGVAVSRTLHSAGYKGSFYKTDKFHCYAVFVQITYDHLLAPPEAKRS
jgi:hypothetical protein